MTKPSNDLTDKIAEIIFVESITDQHAKGHRVLNANQVASEVVTAVMDDLLRELEDKRRDIEANFDITEDGGIDHPDTESGHEHALQFADWTGYNLALSEVKQIIEGKKHD